MADVQFLSFKSLLLSWIVALQIMYIVTGKRRILENHVDKEETWEDSKGGHTTKYYNLRV